MGPRGLRGSEWVGEREDCVYSRSDKFVFFNHSPGALSVVRSERWKEAEAMVCGWMRGALVPFQAMRIISPARARRGGGAAL